MSLRYCTPLLFVALVASSSQAQIPPGDTCAPASAEAFLDPGNVNALIFNNGALFWRGGDHIYEVPKGSGRQSNFASSLWIGGEAGGMTRFAGSDYGPYEYWPGPLNEAGEPEEALCAQYDRIWRVGIADVTAYDETGVATPDLAQWPYEAGAPVLDGDGDPTNYDLAAGDRPAILGEQTLWWVMNDRGGLHRWSELLQLGVEVRATAFAMSEAYAADRYNDPGLGALADVATFYRFEITYRGEEPLTNARVGLFNDPDLGFFSDDYVGGDADRAMAYVYNGDDLDEGAAGYGENPPALGFRMIGADPDDLCIIQWYGDRVQQGNPNGGIEALQYMDCLWRDGSPLVTGGSGYGPGGTPTNVTFPADPPAFWSEMNSDGLGTANTPSDRRILIARALGTLQPGATVTMDFVFPWAQSDAGRVQSVRQMKLASDRLAALPFEPDPRIVPVAGEAEPETPAAPLVVAPNPVHEEATVRLRLAAPAAHARLLVLDALGREVAVLHEGALGQGEHPVALDARAWPPGVYVARLDADGAVTTTRFVVVR